MTTWRQTEELAKNLGYQRYNDYLRSDHWQSLKKQKNPQQCIACPDGWPLVCHHIHYRNLLDVTPEDLAVLCSDCHDAFHIICRRLGMSYIGMREPAIIALLKEHRGTPRFQKWLENKKRRRSERIDKPAKPNNNHRKRPKIKRNEAKKRFKEFLKSPSQVSARQFVEWMTQEYSLTEHNQVTVTAPKPEPAPARAMPARILPPELPIPDCDPIMLTLELVNNCRTPSYGFTNATLKAFGLRKPLIKGWPSLLVGQFISRNHYKTAMEGKFVYNSGPLEWLKPDEPHNAITFGH